MANRVETQSALMVASTPFAALDMFTGVLPEFKLPQVMPDIVTFATSPQFCGKTLYPRQQTILRIVMLEIENLTEYDNWVIDQWIESSKKFDSGGEVLIPIDIRERMQTLRDAGRTHFREFVDVGGRRGGKGYLGGIIGSYLTYEKIMLDDPQDYYGIDKSKDLYINIVATSTTQARKYLFSDVAASIMDCAALTPYIWKVQEEEVRIQTPADIRKFCDMRHKGVKVNKDLASIRITANAATGQSGRGGAAYMQAFDEFAHLAESDSTRSASEVYEAYTPSLDQIGFDAFIYVPSSPYTKVGKFADLYEAGLAVDEDGKALYPEMLVFQHPSWSLYEDWQYNPTIRRPIQQYDKQMMQLEQRNPQKFKVERRARFAETVDAYLDPEVVDKMFNPIEDVELDGSTRIRNLVNKTSGQWNHVYRFHADPSKAQCNFAVAGGHSEVFPDGLYHAIIDYIRVYQPSDFPNDPVTGLPWVDYTQIEDDILNLTKLFPMSEFSFDQFNSVSSIQKIRTGISQRGCANPQMIVRELTFTKQVNWNRCEMFKTAAYMGLIHLPVVEVDYPGTGAINLAEQELKFLREVNGRVDHQTAGSIVTKDLADCIMTVAVELLAEQMSDLIGGEFSNKTMVGAARGGYTMEGALQRIQQPPMTNSLKPQAGTGFGGSFEQLYRRQGRTKG